MQFVLPGLTCYSMCVGGSRQLPPGLAQSDTLQGAGALLWAGLPPFSLSGCACRITSCEQHMGVAVTVSAFVTVKVSPR